MSATAGLRLHLDNFSKRLPGELRQDCKIGRAKIVSLFPLALVVLVAVANRRVVHLAVLGKVLPDVYFHSSVPEGGGGTVGAGPRRPSGAIPRVLLTAENLADFSLGGCIYAGKRLDSCNAFHAN